MSKPTTKRLITYDTLHITVLGPRTAGNDRGAIACVTDFLRTVEHDTRHLLRACAKISPELKGFRVRFG